MRGKTQTSNPDRVGSSRNIATFRDGILLSIKSNWSHQYTTFDDEAFAAQALSSCSLRTVTKENARNIQPRSSVQKSATRGWTGWEPKLWRCHSHANDSGEASAVKSSSSRARVHVSKTLFLTTYVLSPHSGRECLILRSIAGGL